MEKYKFKISRNIKIITSIAFALCLCAMVFTVRNLFQSVLAVDYFSNAFFLGLNLIIITALLYYIIFSNYSLTDKGLVIKTAFFKDLFKYDKIGRIMYYASEDELYLELKQPETGIIRINIKNPEISDFTNELKKRIPDIPYEVSLKIDSDLE